MSLSLFPPSQLILAVLPRIPRALIRIVLQVRVSSGAVTAGADGTRVLRQYGSVVKKLKFWGRGRTGVQGE